MHAPCASAPFYAPFEAQPGQEGLLTEQGTQFPTPFVKLCTSFAYVVSLRHALMVQ